MKLFRPLFARRCNIITDFKKLGFVGRNAFYNVCKTFDATLNGFQLLVFYDGRMLDKKLIARLEEIVECLKHE